MVVEIVADVDGNGFVLIDMYFNPRRTGGEAKRNIRWVALSVGDGKIVFVAGICITDFGRGKTESNKTRISSVAAASVGVDNK